MPASGQKAVFSKSPFGATHGRWPDVSAPHWKYIKRETIEKKINCVFWSWNVDFSILVAPHWAQQNVDFFIKLIFTVYENGFSNQSIFSGVFGDALSNGYNEFEVRPKKCKKSFYVVKRKICYALKKYNICQMLWEIPRLGI